MKREESPDISLKKRFFITFFAFLTISVLVSLLFLSNTKKIDPDKMITKDPHTIKHVRQIVDNSNNDFMVKPLLKSLTRVACPHSSEGYIPICSRCNIPMEATRNKTILKCPICKQRSEVACPSNPTDKMVVLNSMNISKHLTHSSHVCSVCGSTHTPLWDRKGIPRCPYCKNIMIFHNKVGP